MAPVFKKFLPRLVRHHSLRSCISLQRRSIETVIPEHGTQKASRLEYPRFALDPSHHGTWSTVKDIEQRASTLNQGEKANDTVTLTGRIQAKRESSAKLIFYDVVQNGETIQVVVSKGKFADTRQSFADANQALCRGDIACTYHNDMSNTIISTCLSYSIYWCSWQNQQRTSQSLCDK